MLKDIPDSGHWALLHSLFALNEELHAIIYQVKMVDKEVNTYLAFR